MAATHLIVLPCHSVWLGGPSKGQNKQEWILAPFQHQGRDHLCFIDHIHRSVQCVNANADAILVISGGKTKSETEVSEASSYFRLAQELGLDTSRVITEEYARDSMDNVIYSICRFYQYTGGYPQKITVVGFEFKKQRFVENHLKALGFSKNNINYIGNSPNPQLTGADREAYFKDLNESEYNYAVKHFETDWFAIHSPLFDKKQSRNPHNQVIPYASTNPLLGKFFQALDGKESNQDIRHKFMAIYD